MPQGIVRMEGISKIFPGVIALNDVEFSLNEGEIHGLVGENGAGKSTLINILAGLYPPSSGKISLFGKSMSFRHPAEALASGIGVVYQETALVPDFSAEENIWLGREIARLGIIRLKKIKTEAQHLCSRYSIKVPLSVPVKTLRIAEQKLVEVLRALGMDAKILVFDEPTEAMSQDDAENLFRILIDLKKRGLGILYISHHIEEVFKICDRITILRNGERVGTFEATSLTPKELIRHITSRDTAQQYPKETFEKEKHTVLQVSNLSSAKTGLEDVSFSVEQGEIVGFFGMVGSLRTELMKCVFGACAIDSGKISIDGTDKDFKHPKDAMDAGIYFCPENRREEGLILDLTVLDNCITPFLESFTKFGFVRRSKAEVSTSAISKELAIKTPSIKQKVAYLSGGNQQKVVIAKWLIGPKGRVFIFDEPTKGIDVGAKLEVYRLMQKIAKKEAAVIFVSSDLRELLGISDRLYVMSRGRIVAQFQRSEFSQHAILSAALRKDSN